MAATVNSNATAALSPRAPVGEAISGPHAPPRRTTSPPWNQIVRGTESGGTTDPPPLPETPVKAAAAEGGYNQNASQGFNEGSDGGEYGNGSPKQAWNRPHNAFSERGLVVMGAGAVSWPTLSESTSVSLKSTVTDSSANPRDAPISIPQVTAANESSSLASPQKQMSSKPSKPNPNATQHYGRPARQRSMRREGGGSSSPDGGFSQRSMGDHSQYTNIPSKASSGGSDSSGRDHGYNNAAREGSQRSAGDRPQQRTFRRSNSGPHLRGDGSFGGRRDHDRRNNDWNHQRSFNGRDPVMPTQRAGPSPFIRPPPPVAPAYYHPPPIPYGALMSIPPEMQPLYYFAPPSGVPVVPQMPSAVYYPPPDPQLHAKIINQIDYYFSIENLIKDTYLRQNMDANGWVPIQLIAGFKMVRDLTTDIQLILDAVRASTVVEVQGDKIRKRDNWARWVMTSSAEFPTGSQSPRVPQDTLQSRVQGLTLEEKRD